MRIVAEIVYAVCRRVPRRIFKSRSCCALFADNGRIQCIVMRLQVLCFMIKTISYVYVSARADNKAAHVLTGLRPP